MKTQTKQRKSAWKSIAAAALIGVSALTGKLQAEDLRVRTEYNNTQAKDSLLTTVGVGKDGTEFFKAYNHTGAKGDYTSAGFQGKYGAIFGSLGDNQGIGIEPVINLGNAKLTLDAQHSETKNLNRFGGGLDYKLENVTLGAGYDKIGKDDSGLVNAVLNYDANNQLGAVFEKSEENNSALVFQCHYGKNEKIGDRTFVKYDWNNENQTKTICFDSIIAQNPTFSGYSSPWMVSRGSLDTGMYNSDVVENALMAERTPLNNRSKNGLVAELQAFIAEKDETITGNVRADTGYTFSETGGIKPGTLVFYSQDISGAGNNKLGASAILTSGSFCAELTASENLATHVADVYGSLTYSHKF